MAFSYLKLKREIREKNYALVKSSISMQKLELGALYFLHLLESEEFKNNFAAVKIDPDNRSSRIGYFQKTTLKSYPTTTDFFHYNDFFENYFTTEVREANPQLKKFLELARQIYDESKYLMQQIILSFEKDFPEIHQRFFPIEKKPYFYLRFLKYHPDPDSTHLVLGHYDRGACTLALTESGPGLRIGKDEENLAYVEHDPHEVLFLPGLMFPEVTNGEFTPAWHDVPNQEQCWDEKTARWSIVFFAGYSGMRNVHFEEAHTAKEEKKEKS
ncbi:2OG-Fe(II) oxygenase family protein [Candidatus Woesearchaeota archaeon]|nr:2OG-Fe(II) oxygenase family protein [Candidatus Woesearchaeota archaeon]